MLITCGARVVLRQRDRGSGQYLSSFYRTSKQCRKSLALQCHTDYCIDTARISSGESWRGSAESRWYPNFSEPATTVLRRRPSVDRQKFDVAVLSSRGRVFINEILEIKISFEDFVTKNIPWPNAASPAEPGIFWELPSGNSRPRSEDQAGFHFLINLPKSIRISPGPPQPLV